MVEFYCTLGCLLFFSILYLLPFYKYLYDDIGPDWVVIFFFTIYIAVIEHGRTIILKRIIIEFNNNECDNSRDNSQRHFDVPILGLLIRISGLYTK